MVKIISEEARQKIVNLYKHGISLKDVGREVGISHPLVKRILIEQGVPIRPVGSRALTREQERAVVDAWLSGISMLEIAGHLGCSITPVRRAVAASGHEPIHRTSKKLPISLHSEVVDAYQDSAKATCHNLGKKFGTHGNEIRRILLLHGVTPRDGRRRSGTDHPNFKNGKWCGPDGYVRTHVADGDPMEVMRNGRYCLEHRLVMARHLGRPLSDAERVHHKNGIKNDNRIENLELWSYAHPPGQRLSDKPPHCPTCTCDHH